MTRRHSSNKLPAKNLRSRSSGNRCNFEYLEPRYALTLNSVLAGAAADGFSTSDGNTDAEANTYNGSGAYVSYSVASASPPFSGASSGQASGAASTSVTGALPTVGLAASETGRATSIDGVSRYNTDSPANLAAGAGNYTVDAKGTLQITVTGSIFLQSTRAAEFEQADASSGAFMRAEITVHGGTYVFDANGFTSARGSGLSTTFNYTATDPNDASIATGSENSTSYAFLNRIFTMTINLAVDQGDQIQIVSGVSSSASGLVSTNFPDSTYAQSTSGATLGIVSVFTPSPNPPTPPGPGGSVSGNRQDVVILTGDGGGPGRSFEPPWLGVFAAAPPNWPAAQQISTTGGLFVTTADDELDNPTLNPAGYAFNDLSLREAIALAADSNHTGPDTIVIAPWLREIDLGLGALNINSDLTIIGQGADWLTIDAQGLSSVFGITANKTVTLKGLTITGGATAGEGGGIFNWGNLTLDAVRVTGNTAGSQGGGVTSRGDGGSVHATLHIKDSTFDNNTALNGGALHAGVDSGYTLLIEGSTFYDNDGTADSGAMRVNGPGQARIVNSTFSDNYAPVFGAIWVMSGATNVEIQNSTIAYNNGNAGGGLVLSATAKLHNTIVAENKNAAGSADDNINGTANSLSSYNLLDQGGNGNLSGTNKNQVLTSLQTAGLAPLGDYGGLTKTHALLTGSPALDKGNNVYASAKDQRGGSRKYDFPGVTNAQDGDGTDIGAFEESHNTVVIVRSVGDRNDSVASRATVDSLRLREAVALSTALAGNQTIIFDQALHVAGPAEITLTIDGGDSGTAPDTLNISNVTILGPGADELTINGNGAPSVINASQAATIEGVKITGGNGVQGAGIDTNGDLTLRRVRVVGNDATSYGGGIFSSQGNLLIVDSEISENRVTGASGKGGGIMFERDNGKFGSATIINTTISDNRATGASGKGGGVYAHMDEKNQILKFVNSTVANNVAPSGGGLYSEITGNGSQVQAYNTILADNVNLSSAYNEIAGIGLSPLSKHNLLRTNDSGGLTSNNVLLSSSAAAGLSPLDLNGGTTLTHGLLSTSLAIDAGDDSYAAAFDLVFDQRGSDRTQDGNGLGDDEVDIGALEFAGAVVDWWPF